MASEKITALVEQVKELTVLELSELVHTLEEVFGVSAAAAAVAAPAAAAAAEVEEDRVRRYPEERRRFQAGRYQGCPCRYRPGPEGR